MIRYAAADPGISVNFADKLMGSILTMLAPGLDEADPAIQHFHCNGSAVEGFAKMTAICDQLTSGDIIRRGKWNYKQECMVPGDGTEFLSFALQHSRLPTGLHRFATGIEKAIAEFLDPKGIDLVKKLNRVIEDEEGYSRGTLGAAYRHWPLDAYADSDADAD
jgi:hypothetical protein